MQRQILPLGVLGLALGIVVVVLTDGHLLRAQPSAAIRYAFLVPPVLITVALVRFGRGRALSRTAWWRLLVLGYATIVLSDLVRDIGPMPPGPERATTVSLLALTGVVFLVGAVVMWERTHGQNNPLDRALDAGMVAVSLLAAAWVVVVRPELPRHLSLVGVVDLLAAAAAVTAVAAVLAAMASGTLRFPPAVWGAAAGVAQATGDLWDYPAPYGGAHTLGAYWSWLLASAFFACLVDELLHGGPAPAEPAPQRWRPVITGLVFAVPITLYVWEAVVVAGDGPNVPDARVLGVALLLLCIGCLVRVQRAVDQAAELSTRLEGMARSDHLTGLANRRTAEAELRRVMERVSGGTDALTVAVLDLDHFKNFNDQYGHHAGDELLVGAARAWSSCLGSGQLLARLGGEEFLLVAAGLPPSGLAELVERMRALTPRRQSFSAGIATWDGREDGAALVARADGALYEAKTTGRGRTCVAYSADVLGVS